MSAPETSAGRILIVDDNEDARDLLRELLLDHGYDVVTAGTATEGLRYMGRSPFDLLLLDLLLPDCTGLDLISQVRAVDSRMRIVVVSGCCGCLEQSRLAQLGVSRVLTKPFKTSRLLETVAASIGPRRGITGFRPTGQPATAN
jgi:DNA-binding response OmpR family regulator